MSGPDDEDFPLEPEGDEGEASEGAKAVEPVGVEDSDELSAGEIEDGPEQVGLDTETLAGRDALDLSTLVDGEGEAHGEGLADQPLEGFDADLDLQGDEDGWTQDSEASGDVWDDATLGDEELPADDDGGLEGVDDPLLDGLPDELPPLEDDDDEDGDTIVDDLGDDWMREKGRAR
jgi:hypothetical protein